MQAAVKGLREGNMGMVQGRSKVNDWGDESAITVQDK
jgi:hypothetical protein